MTISLLHKRVFGIVIFLILTFTTEARSLIHLLQPSDTLNRTRLNGIVITAGAGLTGTVLALDRLWYAEHPRSSFHFYNDNHHWKQMDKLGHAATAYWIGYHGMQALRWAGVDDRRAIWYGGSIGLPFLTAIEILDGFSAEWGFAWGDQAANFAGAAAMISQELIWEKQIIQFRYSFTRSGLAEYRPELLGENLIQEALKDYNGQTYWLSFPLNPAGNKKLPSWLNFAVGYSGHNMLGAVGNPAHINGDLLPELNRFRQFYLSLDVNLLELETPYPLLNRFLHTVSFIKLPFPAVEYNTLNGFQGHWLKF